MLKATCPSNSEHKKFITTVKSMEEWEVDEHGAFIDRIGSIETLEGPSRERGWYCSECGELARVTYV